MLFRSQHHDRLQVVHHKLPHPTSPRQATGSATTNYHSLQHHDRTHVALPDCRRHDTLRVALSHYKHHNALQVATTLKAALPHTAKYCIQHYFIIIIIKNVVSARPRESDYHPISPTTPAPQYQPTERKKRKGKQ